MKNLCSPNADEKYAVTGKIIVCKMTVTVFI
jgi:hypothetical protein